MKKLALRSAILGFGILIILSCAGSKKSLQEMATTGLDLQYQPAKNAEFVYRINTQSDVSQEMMGQKQNFSSKVVQVFRLKVLDVTEDKIFYSLKFDSLLIDTNTPGMANLDEYRNVILKADIRITSDKKGHISEITGLDEIKKLPLGSNVETQLQDLFIQFPDEPQKIGDSWIEEERRTVTSGPLEIEVQSKTKHTFAGVEEYKGKECLKFTMDIEITLSGSGNQGGVDLVYDGQGTATGIVLMDYAGGALELETIDQTIDGMVSVPAQAMEIPSATKQTTRIERIK